MRFSLELLLQSPTTTSVTVILNKNHFCCQAFGFFFGIFLTFPHCLLVTFTNLHKDDVNNEA